MKEEQKGEIILYQAENGTTKIEVRLENENVWLTQAQLVELYQSSKSNISEHIKHIFEEGELSENSVVRKFRTTATDGKDYNTTYYNLDMIISLGYRIKSPNVSFFTGKNSGFTHDRNRFYIHGVHISFVFEWS